MIRGLRLTDAVIVAAVALLGLKVLGLVNAPAAPPPGSVAAPPEPLPAFARVLAHARTNYVPPEVTATGSVPDKKEAKDAAPAAAEPPPVRPPAFEPTPPSASPSERALLERLGERRDALQQRTRDIEMREQLLQSAERKLDARVNELKALEEKAEAGAAKRGDTEASALKNLVTMYETMKPKDAARVFDRLAHDVLVPVVLQMNPRKMAEVLAVMTPEAAEKLTVALATRAKGLGAERATQQPATAAAVLPPTELPAITAAPLRR